MSLVDIVHVAVNTIQTSVYGKATLQGKYFQHLLEVHMQFHFGFHFPWVKRSDQLE